ncbi:MAG: hypothetical protein IJ545_04740 [Alphaproteobacteria bacterium]|nr:hypothetical protein [Alphaproteobacteria bacterium]
MAIKSIIDLLSEAKSDPKLFRNTFFHRRFSKLFKRGSLFKAWLQKQQKQNDEPTPEQKALAKASEITDSGRTTEAVDSTSEKPTNDEDSVGTYISRRRKNRNSGGNMLSTSDTLGG